MDRQVLSILAPTLQRELSWSESQYAAVVYSFTLVYAFGFLIAGRWLARTTAAFSAARALFGLGESANFPGAIKSVGEWFPKDERALASVALPVLYRSPEVDHTLKGGTMGDLLTFRQTWASVAGKFLADPVWWFYVLAPEIPGCDVWHQARAGRPSSYHGVCNRRRRVYRRPAGTRQFPDSVRSAAATSSCRTTGTKSISEVSK